MSFSMVLQVPGWLNLIVGCSNLKMLFVEAGRPSCNNNDHDKKIRNLLKKDARFTVRQLAWFTNMSLSHDNLKKHLKLKKLNARWIPHLLTKEQKRTWVAVSFLGVLSKNVLVKLNKELNTACCIHTSNLMST